MKKPTLKDKCDYMTRQGVTIRLQPHSVRILMKVFRASKVPEAVEFAKKWDASIDAQYQQLLKWNEHPRGFLRRFDDWLAGYKRERPADE